MSAKIVIEPARDAAGVWCWAVMIDGGEYASGEADSPKDAARQAQVSYEEWMAKQS